MNRLHSLSFALAPFALCACASTSPSDAPPVEDHTSGAEAAKKEEGDKEAEVRKKQRELEYARFQAEIGKSDAQAGELEDKLSAAQAERALSAARAELDNFRGAVRDMETAERALGLDRAKQNVLESEQELQELEAMYAQEQFAKTTKELVLTRGRSHLEMAKRDLDLSQRRSVQASSFDLPKRERDLTEAVEKAEAALNQARAKLERNKLQRKLDGLKAEHAIDEAERALAKAQQSS